MEHLLDTDTVAERICTALLLLVDYSYLAVGVDTGAAAGTGHRQAADDRQRSAQVGQGGDNSPQGQPSPAG